MNQNKPNRRVKPKEKKCKVGKEKFKPCFDHPFLASPSPTRPIATSFWFALIDRKVKGQI